jgi:hypothetical protein
MSTSDDVTFVVYPNTIFTKITSAFITTSGTAFGGSALRVSRMTPRRRETRDERRRAAERRKKNEET